MLQSILVMLQARLTTSLVEVAVNFQMIGGGDLLDLYMMLSLQCYDVMQLYSYAILISCKFYASLERL